MPTKRDMSQHTPPESDHAHYSIDGEVCETCGAIVYRSPEVSHEIC